MNIAAVEAKLQEFEEQIQIVGELFREAFGVCNPLALWRQGGVPRTGSLGTSGVEYSLHGHGCTAEIASRTISFDFEGTDSFVYSPFKFGAYLDDESVTQQELEQHFADLVSNQVLEVVCGRGVRLLNEEGDVRNSLAE